MCRVGTHYSTNRISEKAAEEAARGAVAKSGSEKADIAVVFASSDHRTNLPPVVKIIQDITQAKTLIGTSAYGVLTEETELEQQPAVAVMVIASDAIEATDFLITNLQENSFRAGEISGNIVKANMERPKALFVFPDPFSFHSHPFFDGLENACGYLPLYGGLSSEDGREGKTYQIAGKEIGFDAVAGLALGGDILLESGITRSCQAYGDPFKITRADGNIIYEMDGLPAYDILLESVSNMQLDSTDQILQRVFLGVPMKSFQTDFSESPYLIRNILSVNAKKGVLACASPIEEGEYVTFALRNPSFARLDLRQTLENIALQFAPEKPDFGFYFNCCSRGQSLYGHMDEDVTIIRQHFPNVPLIGFFSYGEIAPVDHVNHLHHHSGVLSFFGA